MKWNNYLRKISSPDNVIVKVKKTIKYNSYAGEVTLPIDNIINSNFKALHPNEKWLTDIIDFAIPVGKVYLSLIVDCFDSLLVTWRIDTSSDSNLVNTMLDSAIQQLQSDEKPIVHSDYAEVCNNVCILGLFHRISGIVFHLI